MSGSVVGLGTDVAAMLNTPIQPPAQSGSTLVADVVASKATNTSPEIGSTATEWLL